MAVKIFVDFNEIELGDQEITLPCTYQLLDVKTLEKRKGSSTKTIVVPRTTRNDKIFGIAWNINARNNFDKFSEHKVIIEENSLVIFDGFLKLTNTTFSKIEFFCFKDISKLKSIFGEKTLQNLDLSDLDHLYNETIFDTWNGTYPSGVAADYFYPVIDYGQFYTKTGPGTSEEPAIKIEELFPMVYNSRIVRQIALDNGYSLKTTFFDDPITAKTGVPFTNSEFIHSSIGGIFVNGLQGYSVTAENYPSPEIGTFVLPIGFVEIDPSGQWDSLNSEYVAGFNQTSNFFGTIGVKVINNTYNISTNILIQKYSGSWSTIRTIPVEAPTFGSGLLSFGINEVLTLASGEKVRFVIEKLETATTIDAKIIELSIDPSAGGKTIEVGEFVQLAPNLPKMKQSDFIQALYKIYNWIINVDDVKGEIQIETFENFYFGGEQIDMSNFLTLDPEPSIQYSPTDFSRKYDFKYKRDSSDWRLLEIDGAQGNAEYLFGNGKLYLGENGQSVLIGEVPFAPTMVSKSFSGGSTSPTTYVDLPTMLIYPYVEGTFTNKIPRMLINSGLQSIETLSGGTNTELYVESLGLQTEIPFAYFHKKIYNDDNLDSITDNLSFSKPKGEGFSNGNLVDKYYKSVLESLSVSPSIVAFFNLNDKIISTLNFQNLWYIDYFKATFRLNKIIDYLPNSKQPTRVELDKVGTYTKTIPTFENYSQTWQT